MELKNGKDATGINDKRAGLLGAAGTPQVGRRDSPSPNNDAARRKRVVIIRSAIICIVAIIAIALIFALIGAGHTIG